MSRSEQKEEGPPVWNWSNVGLPLHPDSPLKSIQSPVRWVVISLCIRSVLFQHQNDEFLKGLYFIHLALPSPPAPPPAHIHMHVWAHTHMDTCCVHTQQLACRRPS